MPLSKPSASDQSEGQAAARRQSDPLGTGPAAAPESQKDVEPVMMFQRHKTTASETSVTSLNTKSANLKLVAGTIPSLNPNLLMPHGASDMDDSSPASPSQPNFRNYIPEECQQSIPSEGGGSSNGGLGTVSTRRKSRNSTVSTIHGVVAARALPPHLKESYSNFDRAAGNVEAYLKLEKQAWDSYLREPKILILGSSDSGKSTLLKQIKMIHGTGFTSFEKQEARSYIYAGIAICLLAIYNVADDRFQEELEGKYSTFLDFLEKYTLEMEGSLISYMQDATTFWKIPKVQELFQNSSKHGLPATTEYFMNEMERILQESYLPTEQDILNCRVVTTEVSDTVLVIQKAKIHFFDVSGLRQDRAVWLQYFDTVNAVLFVTSLSCYDMVLAEDITINRMADSLVLWDQMVNHRLLRQTDFVLFLNKVDMFKKKLKVKPISNVFPDYNGDPKDVGPNLKFVAKKFKSMIQSPDRQKNTTCQITCATDQDSMKRVINQVMQSILVELIKESGF